MGLKEKILSKIPAWVGFLLFSLVGLAFIINGSINSNLSHTAQVGFLVFGAVSLMIGVFSWIVGGTSQIKGRTGTVGVKVGIANMPWWGWLVDVLLLIVGVVVFAVAA